jgi:hypothetical protein
MGPFDPQTWILMPHLPMVAARGATDIETGSYNAERPGDWDPGVRSSRVESVLPANSRLGADQSGFTCRKQSEQ